MRRKTIPQRDLRNDIASVLREAEAGTEFTVTVRGRAVARLGPLDEAPRPRRYVDRETLLRIFRESPVDDRWADDLADLRAFQRSTEEPRDE